MIFPMVSSVNGFPASGLHADSLKQPGQRRVHPAHPDGSPEPWAVRDVAPQHLHMPAHQRLLSLLPRRSPLSATTSITSVRVSSLECLITLSSSSPPPDFAHKPMPIFPVEGDPPVPNLSLCLHVLRSSESVDIYDAGLSASLGKRSRIVRGFVSTLAANGWRGNPDGAMAQPVSDEPRPTLTMDAVKGDFRGMVSPMAVQPALDAPDPEGGRPPLPFFSFLASASLLRRIASYIIYMHGGRRASGEAKPAATFRRKTTTQQQEGTAKMQNRDESTIKAMKAIAALAQVKAIAEELQVDESVALRIVEDVCGGARVLKDYLRTLEGACGHKCREGACKAKEDAQAPAPVSKPAAPEAAPKTAGETWLGSVYRSTKSIEDSTELIKSIESVWSEGTDEVCVGPILVGSQNRLTIPHHIIELAEGVNGMLMSKRHKFGALTVIKGEGKATVLFGDKSAEHEGACVVRLNCNGQAQFCVSPAFTCGDAVECSLLKDGAITITLIGEADQDLIGE